jgi:hypothetical protein
MKNHPVAAVSAKISFNVVFLTPKFTNGLRGERVNLCSLNSCTLGIGEFSLIIHSTIKI